MIDTEAAGLSDQGPVREVNEDYLGRHEPTDAAVRRRKGLLYALADGVGGNAAGEVASSTAVQALIEEYYASSSAGRVEPALRHAIQTANLRVHDAAQRDPELRSMATTLTALALAGTHAYVAHVGDSRAYRWRAGGLTQLTADHSEAAEMVRLRLVAADKLREHPRRNVLTRAIGSRLIVRPDFLRQSVMPEDRFLLCSDGLWGEIDDREIAEALAAPPSEACRHLLDLALGRAGLDNVSLQVVRIAAVTPEDEGGGGRSGWLSGIFRAVRS